MPTAVTGSSSSRISPLSNAYRRDGFVVVPDLLGHQQLTELREIIAELVAAAGKVDTHTAVYDLEPGHTPAEPRVRRIKQPHKVHPAFDAVVRSGPVMEVLAELLGPDLRLQGSKLNMKAARYGSPVEWHQDWAFYPHSNDDMLAIGVMLDDMDLENGPLMVVPGSHKGPIWNHHGEDGRFCGLVNPEDIAAEAASAVALTGRAGSMSFHHVRALHGSASTRPTAAAICCSTRWPPPTPGRSSESPTSTTSTAGCSVAARPWSRG